MNPRAKCRVSLVQAQIQAQDRALALVLPVPILALAPVPVLALVLVLVLDRTLAVLLVLLLALDHSLALDRNKKIHTAAALAPILVLLALLDQDLLQDLALDLVLALRHVPPRVHAAPAPALPVPLLQAVVDHLDPLDHPGLRDHRDLAQDQEAALRAPAEAPVAAEAHLDLSLMFLTVVKLPLTKKPQVQEPHSDPVLFPSSIVPWLDFQTQPSLLISLYLV